MTSHVSGDRILAAGAVFASIGGSAVVGYYIYVHEASGRRFWTAAGITAVSVLAAGLVLVVLGVFRRDGDSSRLKQKQFGGDHSTNLQAGGDIRVNGHPDQPSNDA